MVQILSGFHAHPLLRSLLRYSVWIGVSILSVRKGSDPGIFLLRVLGMFRSCERSHSVILAPQTQFIVGVQQKLAEAIFKSIGTFLLRLAAHSCACRVQELGKMVFFLRPGFADDGHSLSSTGFSISITSTSGCGFIRLGDCPASSPLGLRGFFIDFGVLASTSFLSFTDSSRLPSLSRHHSPGSKLTGFFALSFSSVATIWLLVPPICTLRQCVGQRTPREEDFSRSCGLRDVGWREVNLRGSLPGCCWLLRFASWTYFRFVLPVTAEHVGLRYLLDFSCHGLH